MKKLFLLIILSLACLLMYAADDKQVFMVYGQDFMVNYPLPNTWQVDMDFASRNGINGFFYLKKYGIKDSPVGIIMELAEKPNANSKITDWIEYDKTQLLEYYKEYEFKKINIQRKQEYNYDVLLYEFKNKNNLAHYQNIAYIDCKTKYYVKLYIDCKIFTGNEEYIEDFISGVYGTSYLNIKLEQKK